MAEGRPPSPSDLTAVRKRLGRIGVWFMTTVAEISAEEEQQGAATIEELGYSTFWFGEGPDTRESFTHAAVLLSGTERLNVATGIANIFGRDAIAAANGANTLADAWPGRFTLGMGVSHAPLVNPRGHDYTRPVSTMRAYLDAMDATKFGPPLPEAPPRLLAALRRSMLELAASRAQGAHTYFVPPEHTRRAREILGPEPLLVPEQAVVLDTDADRARAAARDYAAFYLALPNYLNNLRELGFSDADFKNGGSDALIDAIVCHGDPDAITERVRAHHDAGADHVCVQPIARTFAEQVEHLRTLAPVLVG
ncbi:TIGR03620 family F420-dependent LLM class oxidoreductase [Actinoallomurus sp. CA-142502]|uniref:TIGR03620 family F420-dependent LLM class oxidoreductase n=1 Tax=Actinoallomurus sp. CA-142502 TaxID=3239885 RepID=UPI003D8E6EBC